MFKNILLIIVTVFSIGCEDSNLFSSLVGYVKGEEELSPITFELDNEVDENGYVHITSNPNVFQTLFRLKGHLYRNGLPMNVTKMGWGSSHYWILNHYGGYIRDNEYVCVVEECVQPIEETIEGYSVPIINSSSYSREDGEVNTMMGVVHMMKGDTIKILYGHFDEWKSETTYGDFYVIID